MLSKSQIPLEFAGALAWPRGRCFFFGGDCPDHCVITDQPEFHLFALAAKSSQSGTAHRRNAGSGTDASKYVSDSEGVGDPTCSTRHNTY